MMEKIPVSVAGKHAEALGIRFPVSKVDELEGMAARFGLDILRRKGTAAPADPSESQ